MRILVVGYDPHEIGGTQNYTRPLSEEFVKLGHDVFYLYSGAWRRKYNWFLKPYLRINRKDFLFECAELINSPNWVYNFDDPSLDVSSPKIEKLFIKYINKIKPDVMHINSRCGLPASIIEIASKRCIKVFNTIHVYGLLCQKRVLLDDKGIPCEGPSDLIKCVSCRPFLKVKKIKFLIRMENTSKKLLKFLVELRRKLGKGIEERTINHIRGVSTKKEISVKALKERLDYMVYVMNTHIVKNICVSSDVRNRFIRFGVSEKKLEVRHIGSVIAKNQKRDMHPLHNPIVIGNIGGVGEYKGTHVLLEAASMLQNKNFEVKIFGRYEQHFLDKIYKGKEALPINFLGRYVPEDLPNILEEIDIMVLPSICSDTAPQTIFESYSARIPIVASNIGGFPDFVKDGINGYLFKPGDSKGLAEKLDNILSDPDQFISFASKIPQLKTITESALELISMFEESLDRSN